MASPKFKAGFSGGELDPRFRDRVTTAIHQNSLQKGENMMATKGGSLRPRYSTEHVMTLGKDKTDLKLFPIHSRNLFFEADSARKGRFIDPSQGQYYGALDIPDASGDLVNDGFDFETGYSLDSFAGDVYTSGLEDVSIDLDGNFLDSGSYLTEASSANIVLVGSRTENIHFRLDGLLDNFYFQVARAFSLDTTISTGTTTRSITVYFNMKVINGHNSDGQTRLFASSGGPSGNVSLFFPVDIVAGPAGDTITGNLSFKADLFGGFDAFDFFTVFGDVYVRDNLETGLVSFWKELAHATFTSQAQSVQIFTIDITSATKQAPSLGDGLILDNEYIFFDSNAYYGFRVLTDGLHGGKFGIDAGDGAGPEVASSYLVPNSFFGTTLDGHATFNMSLRSILDGPPGNLPAVGNPPVSPGRDNPFKGSSVSTALPTSNQVEYQFTLVQNGIESRPVSFVAVNAAGENADVLTHFGLPASGQHNTLTVYFNYKNLELFEDLYDGLPRVDFVRFYRRPLGGGVYGYVGESSINTVTIDPPPEDSGIDTDDAFSTNEAKFRDEGGDPDFTNNPSQPVSNRNLSPFEIAFSPQALSFAQQRLFIANGNAMEASQIQGPFVETSPITSASALSTLIGDDYPSVRYLHNSKWGLLSFTDRGIYINNGIFALENLGFEKAAENDIIQKDLPPLKALDSVYYFSQTTNSVMALTYSRESQSIRSVNVSWMSDHIFRNKKIVSWDVLVGENPQVIAVFSDGTFATRALEGDPDGERGWFPQSMALPVKQVLTLDLVTYIVVQKGSHFFLEKFITESNENYLFLMDGAVNLTVDSSFFTKAKHLFGDLIWFVDPENNDWSKLTIDSNTRRLEDYPELNEYQGLQGRTVRLGRRFVQDGETLPVSSSDGSSLYTPLKAKEAWFSFLRGKSMSVSGKPFPNEYATEMVFYKDLGPITPNVAVSELNGRYQAVLQSGWSTHGTIYFQNDTPFLFELLSIILLFNDERMDRRRGRRV